MTADAGFFILSNIIQFLTFRFESLHCIDVLLLNLELLPSQTTRQLVVVMSLHLSLS